VQEHDEVAEAAQLVAGIDDESRFRGEDDGSLVGDDVERLVVAVGAGAVAAADASAGDREQEGRGSFVAARGAELP